MATPLANVDLKFSGPGMPECLITAGLQAVANPRSHVLDRQSQIGKRQFN
jgi:hypothetical protein